MAQNDTPLKNDVQSTDTEAIEPRAIPAIELLQAIPLLHPAAQTILHHRYGKCLEYTAAGQKWWNKWWTRKHHLQLDQQGTQIIEAMDGKKNVAAVAQSLDLPQKDAEIATLAFITSLAQRGWVSLGE